MGAEALTQQALAEAMKTITGWALDSDAITKTYQFDSYLAGIAFVGAVGTIAEAHDHHPDMTVGWRKVTVTFTTHDAGSKITENAIAAATAIEALGYPKK